MTERPRLGPGLIVSILAPFALGYFLSYLYRSVNAVTAPDLVRDIGLSAGELGFLTAAYLLAFAGFQLPLGVLLDRYGPRRVQAVLMAVTGAGALLFAAAGGFWTLSAGRALIGIGCAGGLMAGFQAVALWLRSGSDGHRALVRGYLEAAGFHRQSQAREPLEIRGAEVEGARAAQVRHGVGEARAQVEGAAGDGLPVELGQHRLQRRRVAWLDPRPGPRTR